MQLRQYKVYVIGNRASTETTVLAKGRDNARLKFASRIGKKSFEVEAIWDRNVKVPTLGYCASR